MMPTRRRRRQQRQQQQQQQQQQDMKEFSFAAIASATNGFAVENLVGKGSHGSVYRGKLENGLLVAVKKPPARTAGDASGDDAKMRNEIDVLASTAGPRIVNLVGVGRDAAGGPLLVLQFMPNGSLRDLLRRPSPPSWPRRAAIALQIARAVASLHGASPPIVHRDIKSENILFDGDWNARLADFSLAVRSPPPPSAPAAPPAGTIGYLDPSYTDSARLSPKNDVFSFGVVLLEIISSRKAMDADGNPCSIVAWAAPMIRARRYGEVVDKRVKVSAGAGRRSVARALRVAARCAAESAEERPWMEEVVRELEGAVDECVRSWTSHGIWGLIRSHRVCDRLCDCVRDWRKGVRRRVGTRRIVCKDHLVVGGNDNNDDDDEEEEEEEEGEFDLDLGTGKV